MHSNKHFVSVLWGSIFLCAAAAVLSLCLGSICISPVGIIRELAGGGMTSNIIKYSRLPRTLACMTAGAGLAAAGAVLQQVLANKLASPSIIGINAGAGLGVTVCCALGVFSGWMLSLSAFFGSLITVALISVFSGKGGISKTTVILGGVALNSILNAASESITVLNPDVSIMTSEFRVGGFSSVSSSRLLPAAALIILALIVLFTLFNELDILGLGDENAHAVGLPAKKYRALFLCLSALLSGATVSFAGLLGFVGLIIPHLVRRLIGSESRHLLPVSVFTGAGFVTLCDLAARTLFLPYELPVGIIMSIIGGPVFIWLIIRFKGGHSND